MVKLGLIFLAHTIGVNDWIASVKMVTSIRATKSTIRTSARRWTIFSMQSNFCCVSCKYCPTQTYANSHHRQSVQYFYYSSLPDSTTNKEFDNWFSICEKKNTHNRRSHNHLIPIIDSSTKHVKNEAFVEGLLDRVVRHDQFDTHTNMACSYFL